MNWMKAIKKSIDYIEEHLVEEMSINDIAAVATVSPFYYQRMFLMLTDLSVQTYIRNRRLSLAAAELISSDVKIIDLAFKYGYESSESFSRAFKKLHGANFRAIPVFWQDIMKDGSFEKMMSQSDSKICLGACMQMDSDKDTEFDYVIGAFCESKQDDYSNYEVPEHEWAVFELRGPISETIQSTWKQIFSEWFPQSGFKHANLPEFEVYYEGDVNGEAYYMELWIPIIK